METATDHAAPAPAGFWIRVAAVLVDGLLFVAVEALLAFSAGLVWGPDIAEVPVFGPTVSVFMLVFGAVYYLVMHAIFGQTVGKMVFHLRVVEGDGRPLGLGTAVLRSFGYSISALTFGIGFLLAGARRDKRALHDLIAGTRVIRPAASRSALHDTVPAAASAEGGSERGPIMAQ